MNPEPNRRALLARLNPVAMLEVFGLGAISVAFGMVQPEWGVGALGVSALVLAWSVERGRSR